MNAKLLLIIPLISLVACNSKELKEHTEEQKTTYNIVTTKHSPYLNVYLGNTETILQYNFVEYPYKKRGPLRVKERNMGDNTIMLNEEVGVRIHDSYTIDNDGKTAHFQIIRDASVVYPKAKELPKREQRRMMTYEPYSYSIDVQMVDSIHIIRPSTDECHCIPMCYYDQMEIEWNPDYNNTNGVLIIAEWNGVLMNGPTMNSGNTIGIDLVEDNGVAILNNSLFNGMPDEALVNLWLLRANVADISHVGDGTLENLIEKANEDPELLESLMEENPEYMFALQTMIVGCGAVAVLPFYLIRNLE